jgi:hypothetical protein
MEISTARILKTTVLRKIQKGPYVNIRRTIGDLTAINDYEEDGKCRDSTGEMLVKYLEGNTQKNDVLTKTITDMNKVLISITEKVNKLEASK